VSGGWRRIRGVSSSPSFPYVAFLTEIGQMQEALKHLETHLKRIETQLLKSMHDVGVTDDVIGTELGISSQAVGKKRRRRV
jgi:hypothetical protein